MLLSYFSFQCCRVRGSGCVSKLHRPFMGNVLTGQQISPKITKSEKGCTCDTLQWYPVMHAQKSPCITRLLQDLTRGILDQKCRLQNSVKVAKARLKCVCLLAVHKQEPHVRVWRVSKPLCVHAFNILLLFLGSRSERHGFRSSIFPERC